MSTKKLSRTVIEGGRYNPNKFFRRHSHKEERAYEREYLDVIKIDPEICDELDVKPLVKVGKDFKDKLGPMFRWLNAQIGKPWDDIYSEVIEKFDTRTTAGRHIVFDHLLRSVEIVPNASHPANEDGTSFQENDFYVDDSGLLCKRKYIKRQYNNFFVRSRKTFNTQKIADWLNGGVIGTVGEQLFWFVPTLKGKKHHGRFCEVKTEWKNMPSYNGGGLRYLYLWTKTIYDADNKPIGQEPVWQDYTPTFRQDKRLVGKDLEFWNNIPEFYQKQILQRSPTYIEQ